MTLGGLFIKTSTLIGGFSKKENVSVSNLFGNKTKRAVRGWYKYKTNYWLNIEEL